MTREKTISISTSWQAMARSKYSSLAVGEWLCEISLCFLAAIAYGLSEVICASPDVRIEWLTVLFAHSRVFSSCFGLFLCCFGLFLYSAQRSPGVDPLRRITRALCATSGFCGQIRVYRISKAAHFAAVAKSQRAETQGQRQAGQSDRDRGRDCLARGRYGPGLFRRGASTKITLLFKANRPCAIWPVLTPTITAGKMRLPYAAAWMKYRRHCKKNCKSA